MNGLKVVRSALTMAALYWSFLLAMVPACAETAQRAEMTPEQIQARERHRAERMAEIEEYKRRMRAEEARQADEAREQEKHAQEQIERVRAYRAELAEEKERLERFARERIEHDRQVREEREQAEAPAKAWIAEHCTIDFPLATATVVCDPTCRQVRIQPCPTYRCKGSPPDSTWVHTAEQRACSRAVWGSP